MSATAAAPEPLIGRCYTKARRHQNVIGNAPGGGRIWGGPYTWPQVIVAAATLAVLLLTAGLWAHHGLLDALPLLGVPYALALVVGRVHVDGRSPFSVAASALGLAVSGSSGRMDGRPVRRPRRGAAVGVCTLTWLPATRAEAGAPSAQPVHAIAASHAWETVAATDRPVAGAPVVRVTSGVGALLAARASGRTTTNTNGRGQ
ncbi:hypothetical protein ACO0M4_28970 [Streptomyces sp. RGM 3693]|uniref:hypothetical protein n=1 Tax=Streptomyces sp. RGM 3693 TaxID=3413284 RepID=UPI003D2A873C